MPSSRIIGVIEFRKIVGRGLHTCTLKVFLDCIQNFSCKGLYDLDNDRRMCLTDESQYLMNQSADTCMRSFKNQEYLMLALTDPVLPHAGLRSKHEKTRLISTDFKGFLARYACS